MSTRRRCFRWLAALLILVVACGCGGGAGYRYRDASAVHMNVDGERALRHVEALVELGPRPAGTEAIEKSRIYIQEQLEAVGWEVRRQTFEAPTPVGRITFVNVRARYAGDGGGDVWGRRVSTVIGSHYDTKLYSGFEFVGANDGGSSTGLLIELGRVLAGNPALAREIELVCFDGEECFVRYTPTDGLYGSLEYSKMLREMPEAVRPSFGIIFDMIGDKELNVALPTNGSRRLAGLLFKAAEELGTREHFGSHGGPIIDDHVPLANVGLEVMDLIDLDYPVWHTAGDRMDQLSAESIEICGQAGLLMIEKYLLGEVTE